MTAIMGLAKTWLDIYNAIQLLKNKSYLSESEYYKKIDDLIYDVMGKLAVMQTAIVEVKDDTM